MDWVLCTSTVTLHVYTKESVDHFWSVKYALLLSIKEASHTMLPISGTLQTARSEHCQLWDGQYKSQFH